jgi:hypothetical protein
MDFLYQRKAIMAKSYNDKGVSSNKVAPGNMKAK